MSYQGPFVLSQVFAVVHRQQFHRCVSRHRGDYKVRHFTCRAQFICLVFAQLTHRESLRDTSKVTSNCVKVRLERRQALGTHAKSREPEATQPCGVIVACGLLI